ncbi:MAG: CotH kinase family protein [Pirellulaceae bacterium]
MKISIPVLAIGLALCVMPSVSAQPPGPMGGPMGGEDRKILKDYDTNNDGWLNLEEREKALEFLRANPAPRRGPGGFGPGGPGRFGPPGADQPPRQPGEPGRPGQPPPNQEGPPQQGPPQGGPPELGPPGFGPPGGPGGPPPGFGPPGMRNNRDPAKKGKSISKKSVDPIEGALYDNNVLRTIFIDFDSKEWEEELELFHGTDVDVPATLTVDGKEYPNCGVRFRGASSYMMVPRGYKRSLNVSMDLAIDSQRLMGYKTLNLLNSSSDSSMMSSVLYSHIAEKYLPAPKANFVRVVINGENWGIYSNVEQFNKDFVKDRFGTDQGGRWKVSGSPAGGGGLDYRGDDLDKYGYPYEQKSGGKEATKKLVEFCKILNESTADELPAKLESVADVDELLWFLALDIGLINTDGYWIRASDYSIYLDEQNKFHFVPHDMNEAFRAGGGPGPGGPGGFRNRGGRRGEGVGGAPGENTGPPNREGPPEGFPPPGFPPGEPGRGGPPGAGDPPGFPPGGFGGPAGNGIELDPLSGLDDPMKPLRSKVLQVPQYRERYLANLRTLANESLDWKYLGPFVESQVELIKKDVKLDTKKLSTLEEFEQATSEKHVESSEANGPRGHSAMNLKAFADGRREYLLKVTDQEKK